MDILIWVGLGIAAGSIAKWMTDAKISVGMTIVLGIAGAFVGGFLGRFLPFLQPGADAVISIGSLFTATIGAVIIIWLCRKMK